MPFKARAADLTKRSTESQGTKSLRGFFSLSGNQSVEQENGDGQPLAALYDHIKSFEDPQDILIRNIESLHSIDGADVVELGCGTGYVTRKLARRVRSVHAYDISRHMLRVARRLCARASLGNCAFAVADHRSIPLPDSIADVVVAAWSILSLVDATWDQDWQAQLDRCLSEARRLLKTDGTIMIVETANLFGELQDGEVWHPIRREFLSYLEDHHGFSKTHFRRLWRYRSANQAFRLTSLFHGGHVARTIRKSNLSFVTESIALS